MKPSSLAWMPAEDPELRLSLYNYDFHHYYVHILKEGDDNTGFSIAVEVPSTARVARPERKRKRPDFLKA